ncbi:MAG: phytanoyl-CoA dioxygenase family protein [Planctomycetes bacterium]|nr:phytanoyl-CoA dioxygenase family protein [Planctomycetota bacterium]
MLSDAQKSFFDANGYLVLEDVITGALLDDIRAAALALVAADPADTQVRVWHERVLYRRAPFRQIFKLPRLVESARDLIGPDVQLLALDLLYTAAGAGGVGWHRDVRFTCDKTLSMNTGIYLYDMTPEMGQLRVIPGSHRNEPPAPPNDKPAPGEVLAPVRAGTAVFFDAALLHSGAQNNSKQARLALFPYFGRYFIKRMDNYFTQPLPAELAQSTDPLTRQLLGLGLTPCAPNYHGDDEAYNRARGEAGIDFPA